MPPRRREPERGVETPAEPLEVVCEHDEHARTKGISVSEMVAAPAIPIRGRRQ